MIRIPSAPERIGVGVRRFAMFFASGSLFAKLH